MSAPDGKKVKSKPRPSGGPPAVDAYGQTRSFRIFCLLLFEVAFFIHLSMSFVGWDRPITDNHSFRQCQTAISSYYTIQDGFKLAYETPVLGKPWSIPMEFPLYQWLVAGTVIAFHTALDPTGRFWSLVFFYLSLLPLYSLLGRLIEGREKRLLVLSFILLDPTYLFWSRTFMMESLALFLGLVYLWACAKALLDGKNEKIFLLLAVLLGSLVGTVKATSWAAYCLPCGLLIVWSWLRARRPGAALPPFSKPLGYGAIILLGPFLATLGWTHFADGVKDLNPMAIDLLDSHSRIQKDWIFGSASERLSPAVWANILNNTHLFGWEKGYKWQIISLLILAGLAYAIPLKRVAKTICFSCFIFPILIFTNLYFVHDYYLYANGLFLSAFIGITVLTLLESFPQKPARALLYVLVPLCLSSFYFGYLSYYHIFREDPTDVGLVSRLIREKTDKDGILLIYGLDWDSTIPYYSQRRALMDRWDLPLDDPKMKKAIEDLGEDRIQGMLISGPRDIPFIMERVKFFHLSPNALRYKDLLYFPKE